MPRAILRAAFRLSDCRKHVARDFHANATTVAKAQMSVASTFCDLQGQSIDEHIVRSGKHNWLLYTLQWDETSFTVKANDGPPCVQSILSQHGVLRWETADEQEHVQEVVLPPCILQDKSANGMLGAIVARHAPSGVSGILDSALFSCFSPCIDSVAANLLMVKHFNSVLPDHVLLLVCICLQHQAGLVLSPLAVAFGFLSGLFCMVKVLQSGTHLQALRSALRDVLDEELVIDATTLPDPCSSEKMMALIEIAARAAENNDEKALSSALTLEEQWAITQIFTGDPSSEQPVHHCRGCCASRRESIDKAVYALLVPLDKRISVPALNRWLSVWPCVCVLCVF